MRISVILKFVICIAFIGFVLAMVTFSTIYLNGQGIADPDTLFQYQRAFEGVITMVVAIIIVYAIVFLLILFSSINNLFRIYRAVEEYKKQNFLYRIENISNDELGRIAATINELMENEEKAKKYSQLFMRNVANILLKPAQFLEQELNQIEKLLLKKPTQKKKIDEALKRVGVLLEDAYHLSSTLVQYLELGSGKHNVDRKKISIKNVIQEILENYKDQIRLKRLKVSVLTERNHFFIGDEEEVVRAVTHVFQNAVDYSQKGGRIELISFLENEQVVLEINDEGIGIPSNEVKEVTEPFFRALNAQLRKQFGCGLGLTIANILIKENGGRLSISSQEEYGTQVRIELPAPRI